MTASVLAAHREAAAKAGMDGFASKPVDWHALSHEIAKVLALPAVVRAAAIGSAAPPGAEPESRPAALGRQRGHTIRRCTASWPTTARRRHAGQAAGHGSEARLAEAQAWCHKVRGVAANIGLEQLSATLAQLEKLCGSPQRDGAAQHLSRAANGAGAGPAHAGGAAGCGAERHPCAAPPRGPARLEAPPPAAPSIRHRAPEMRRSATIPAARRLNDAALTALTAALTGAPPALAQQLGAVQDALNDFDFPQAQAALEASLASLATE
jgi:CheY-like chemotaxis protein